MADAHDIWMWRNDIQTRAMSINVDEVSWDSHRTWFLNTLTNHNRSLLIGSLDEAKIGICRFDIDSGSNTAEVSININPAMRGKKLSHALLTAAIQAFWHTQKINLVATIKKQNTASIQCFIQSGFVFDSETEQYNYYKLLT